MHSKTPAVSAPGSCQPRITGGTALCNSYTLEMGKMSRNHFEATELIPMPCAKPNHEQKPNWRY